MTDAADTLQPLGREALAVRRLRVVIETVVTILFVVAANLAFQWNVRSLPAVAWVAPVVVLALGLVGWWWTGLDHSRWRWRLTEDLFEVRRGVLIRKVHLVPRSRIQNVTTEAGPLQRRFGVLTLTVHTAGTRTKNVSVRDIDAGHAESIRRRLGLV